MKKLKGSWLQILLCIAIPVIILLINSLAVVNSLSINAVPLDDSLASEDFANLYSSAFFSAFITCIAVNVLIVLAMIFLNMNSMAMWFIFLILNIALSCFNIYSFTSDFPADTDSVTLISVMYAALFFATYFISSVFTCSDFKHFNPIARFVRR